MYSITRLIRDAGLRFGILKANETKGFFMSGCMRPAFFRTALLPFFTLFLLFTLAGCGRGKDSGLHEILAIRGDSAQAAKVNTEFADDVLLRAVNAAGDPIPDVRLKISAKPGSQLTFRDALGGSDKAFLPSVELTSDAGGEIRVRVKSGAQTGDQYMLVEQPGSQKHTEIRFLSGLEISGANQEASAGGRLPEPYCVRLTDELGAPVSGVDVVYTFNGKKSTVRTDAGGAAPVTLTVGKETGKYPLNVKVNQPGFDQFSSPQMGLNLWSMLINVFGGLAIFIFGMKMTSDGLHIAARERMRTILHFFSSNRYVAILAGTLVTAVMQSSSASTVMVIGFVNAGLLTLTQSIGIIFGANIGTTVTAQLVAFNMSAIIMPAIILGLAMLFISWPRLRGWGETFLGFGFLFMGMGLMSSELKPLGEFSTFIQFFQKFRCAPVDGSVPFGALLGAIAVGIIVTVVIQSSLATTGIVIALGGSGLMDLYTAVAIVLGSNIGTTITAQIASIPANRVAKQTAFAHTLFNLIGVLLLLPFFWIKLPGANAPLFFSAVNAVTSGNAFAAIPQNLPRHIANAHTLFNVFTTIVLIPFIPFLAFLCQKMIPLGTKKIKFTSLEPHLLDMPSLALEQTGLTLRKMLKKAWKMIDNASEKYFIPGVVDDDKFALLAKKEERIDQLQYEITSYLTQIMSRPLTAAQAAVIPLLMHCTNDAERIADHTENIVALTRRLRESGQTLSENAVEELNSIHALLKEQAVCTLASLAMYEPARVATALENEKKIEVAAKEFEDNHIKRLGEQVCSPITGVIFIEFIAELVKVSGHLTNIAERAQRLSSSYLSIASELHKKAVSMTRFAKTAVPAGPAADDEAE